MQFPHRLRDFFKFCFHHFLFQKNIRPKYKSRIIRERAAEGNKKEQFALDSNGAEDETRTRMPFGARS